MSDKKSIAIIIGLTVFAIDRVATVKATMELQQKLRNAQAMNQYYLDALKFITPMLDQADIQKVIDRVDVDIAFYEIMNPED